MTMLSFLHLTVFEAVYRLKSVMLAAESLDMPQPTLSRHLKVLRLHFQNPLFVRTRQGLEPTSLAMTAAPAISQALELYRMRLSGGEQFDPEESDRNFAIAASDIGHLLIMQRLVSWAIKKAPQTRFTATPLGRAKLIAQLESGEVDLAIGSFPNLFAGVLEQTLFQEAYVCVVPRSYMPRGQLTMAKFKAANHIVVDGRHLGHIHEEVERKLMALVGRSGVRMLAENFLMSAHVAQQSDLILTVPSHVADILNQEQVRIMKPPLELPGFAVKQYWHERFNEDEGNAWLRSGVARLCRIGAGELNAHPESG